MVLEPDLAIDIFNLKSSRCLTLVKISKGSNEGPKLNMAKDLSVKCRAISSYDDIKGSVSHANNLVITTNDLGKL